MKHVCKYISFLIVCLSAVFSVNAQTFQNETLNYKVLYKWGLVQKQAGRATLQLTQKNNHYVATLYARSENWADKFYKLRDTLISHMDTRDLLPVKYQRIAHENGTFAHDIIDIQREIGNPNGIVKGTSTRIRQNKNSENLSQTVLELEAQGATVDMLSAFYFIRTFDFKNLRPGDERKINIFSGKKKELLTIKYIGEEQLSQEGKQYPTYKISFTFTSEGKNKSSDDIITWIWANDSKIPLRMEGKLKVGKIRCVYTGD